jgi:hypothetical protein
MSLLGLTHMPDWGYSLAGFCHAPLYRGGGLDVIRKEAWPFYRTSSGVRLCWKLEEPKGPKGGQKPLDTVEAPCSECRHAARQRKAEGSASVQGKECVQQPLDTPESLASRSTCIHVQGSLAHKKTHPPRTLHVYRTHVQGIPRSEGVTPPPRGTVWM